MATKKKTDEPQNKPAKKAVAKPAAKKAAKPAAKTPKAPKAEVKPYARHPKARLTEAHTSKEALAKSLAEVLAREDEDTDQIADRLRTASNQQLLRLRQVADTVKEKYGDRSKMIAAITSAQNKTKDKDYVAKLDTYSLPQLLDLAGRA
jgi:hypothetical protein